MTAGPASSADAKSASTDVRGGSWGADTARPASSAASSIAGSSSCCCDAVSLERFREAVLSAPAKPFEDGPAAAAPHGASTAAAALRFGRHSGDEAEGGAPGPPRAAWPWPGSIASPCRSGDRPGSQPGGSTAEVDMDAEIWQLEPGESERASGNAGLAAASARMAAQRPVPCKFSIRHPWPCEARRPLALAANAGPHPHALGQNGPCTHVKARMCVGVPTLGSTTAARSSSRSPGLTRGTTAMEEAPWREGTGGEQQGPRLAAVTCVRAPKRFALARRVRAVKERATCEGPGAGSRGGQQGKRRPAWGHG